MTGCAAQMLDALGATSIRLLSNNPDKAARLTALGISVTEQVPTGVYLSPAALTIWFPACGNGRRKRSSCAASRRQP
jgi:hypothetical protein